MEKVRLLYIDDELHNLNAFKASFRRDYEIYTTTQVSEARKILEKYDIPIIISDQRMPGTTGIQFFHSIKKSYPNSIRILITAYTEIDALVDAINKGQIFRFIKKPWEYYDLQNTITNAYDIYQTRKELNQKIKGIGRNLEERKKFIAHISEDIRSILLSSIGIVNTAKTDPALEEAKEYFNLLGENLGRLKGFLQQMVGYYKNADTLLKYEEIYFEELVQDSLKNFQNTSLDFQTDICQKQPFISDLFRIQIILNNLISNAVRFRKPEAARSGISVSVVVDENGAEINISDKGIGIPEKDREKIFDLFFHSKNKSAGSGIGLYVVDVAVARLNGEIKVSSKVGEGTTVVVSLPHWEE